MKFVKQLAYIICCSQLSYAATYHVAQQHPNAVDQDESGSSDKPYKTIGAAVKKLSAGDTLVIHAGIYRESVVVKALGTKEEPIKIHAARYAYVEMNGAEVVKKLTKVNADSKDIVYEASWNKSRFLQEHLENISHPNDDYHFIVGRTDQIFVDRIRLLQVAERNQVTRGTFYVDHDQQKVFFQDFGNRELKQVIIPNRSILLQLDGNHIEVKGITFRYGTNAAQRGVLETFGDHNRILDCIIESTNGSGARFEGENNYVENCIFRNNGQMGFKGFKSHGLHMKGCIVEDNNTKGYKRGWEAGASKIGFARNVILEQNIFRNNRGCGIWFDISNEKAVIRNNFIHDNEGAGIFYEISYSGHIHDNIVFRNGLVATHVSWGANGGISISSSPDCIVERNLVVMNREGIQFREQYRTTSPIEGGKKKIPIWNENIIVRNNILVHNQSYEIGMWAAVPDKRYWPNEKVESGERKTEQEGDIMKDYLAKNADGQPTGASLQDLNIHFEHNIVDAQSGSDFILWGAKWVKHKKYKDFAAFEEELSVGKNNTQTKIQLQDVNRYDFRMQSNEFNQCYPKGEILGVKSGIEK